MGEVVGLDAGGLLRILTSRCGAVHALHSTSLEYAHDLLLEVLYKLQPTRLVWHLFKFRGHSSSDRVGQPEDQDGTALCQSTQPSCPITHEYLRLSVLALPFYQSEEQPAAVRRHLTVRDLHVPFV